MNEPSVGNIAVGCDTVTFAAETPNAFQRAGQPPNLPLPAENLDPVYYMVAWAYTSQPPKTASRSVEPFLNGS